MNSIHHRPSPRVRRSPLHAGLLAALGLTALTPAASAAPHEYTVDETVTDERTHAGGFRVGTDDPVVVQVREQGHLIAAGTITLGENAGGKGTLLVDGPDARVTGRSLIVGRRGDGVLRVENGAQAVFDGTVATEVSGSTGPHGSGRIEIRGNGSTLTANRVMVTTQFLLEDGGQVRSQQARLGDSFRGPGTAVMRGAGTVWENSNDMDLYAGLDVLEGAQLRTGTLQVSGGRPSGQPNTAAEVEQVRVHGAGSSITAAAGITISGTNVAGTYGVLTASDGGHVAAGGDITLGTGGYLALGGGLASWGDPDARMWSDATAAGSLDDSTITFRDRAGGLVLNHTGVLTLGNDLRSDRSGISWNGGAVHQLAGTTTLAGDLRAFGGVINVHGGELVIDSDLYADGEGYAGVGGYMPKQISLVDGGTLVLNGSAGFLHEDETGRRVRTATATVYGSGVLAGAGTVGDTWVADGGTLSPGHGGVGTFTVDGDLYFNAGGLGPEHVDTTAYYDVDLLADGRSDRLKVTGHANLGHGAQTPGAQGDTAVRVTALDPATGYQNGQRYTILEADGGISGAFNEVISTSAFITGTLIHTATTVEMDITLNVEGGEDPDPTAPPRVFAQVASTHNQRAVAAGLDSLHQSGDALALYNQLLMLDADSARTAFDELSGEPYASQRALLLDDRFLRDGIAQRLRPDPGQAADGVSAWAAASGDARSQRGDATASPARDHRQGLIVGADWTAGERWTVGVAGGPATLRQQTRDRSATTEVDALQGALYAAFRRGAAWFQGGTGYADYQVETERRLGASQPWSQTLRARYGASALSAFAEAGWDLALESLTLTPYTALSYTRLRTEAHEETGGSAALATRASRDEVWTTTAGVRAAWDIKHGGRERARVEGGLAWLHRAGEVRADATHRFVAGSDAFTVQGLALARNVGIAELGVALSPTDNSRLALFAQGRRGSGERGFGAQASWTVAF